MPINVKDNPLPQIKLNRFLYLMSEEPKYTSGEPHVHKCFEKEKLTSIEALIAADKTHDILPLILKAAKDPTCPRKDGAIFALAACTRSSKKTLQTQAYSALKEICLTPDELFLFIKFFIKLADHKGFGMGFKKCIMKWYFAHDPMALAQMVTRVRGRNGWKHKDIINMVHIKVPETAMDTIITYVCKGLKEAEKKNSYPGAKEILDHFKLVESFKHIEDTVKLAEMIQQHKLQLEQVPPPFLTHGDIWNALLPALPFPELLKVLPKLSNYGLLKPNSPVLTTVTHLLKNPENVKLSGIHPVQVLIALRDYENNGKCPDYKKLQHLKELEAKKIKVEPQVPSESGDAPPPQRTKPAPITAIVGSLYGILNHSFQNIMKTDASYMISIDTRDHMNEKCFKCGNVTAYEAGVLILLSIYKIQKDVVIAVFNDRGVQVVNLDKRISLKDAESRLRNIKNGYTQFQKPFDWAEKKKKPIDVFINIYHSSKMCFQMPKALRTNVNVRNSLENYRAKINREAKLISMNLCSHKSPTATGIAGMIDICGFDENIPKIIESVANGALK